MTLALIAGERTQRINVEIEVKSFRALRQCVNRIDLENPNTREAVAAIVRDEGFDCHVGGRHVAILDDKERIAIVTHPVAPDFN